MPAAITALDFSRPAARPPFFGAAGGAGRRCRGGAGVQRLVGRGAGAAGPGLAVRRGGRRRGRLPAAAPTGDRRAAAALLLVAEEMGEGVRLVAAARRPGSTRSSTPTNWVRARVVAVRQVTGSGPSGLGRRGLGPHAAGRGRTADWAAARTAAAAAGRCPGAAAGARHGRRAPRPPGPGRRGPAPGRGPGRRRPGGTGPRAAAAAPGRARRGGPSG